jgi:hypothetical protein
MLVLHHTHSALSSPNHFRHQSGDGGGGGGRGGVDEVAEAAHAALRHPHGDAPTYINVYKAWEGAGCSDEWARANFIRIR